MTCTCTVPATFTATITATIRLVGFDDPLSSGRPGRDDKHPQEAVSMCIRRSTLVWLLLALAPAGARADVATLKIATLAPEGSAWMKLFGDWKGAIEKRTSGQVKIKFYAGGVAGDERDVVRKMRLGQMSGAAITAVGLGLIQPDVRVLEIPFLFRDESELDLVRGTLAGEFHKKFEDKGYQLLAWGDVGPVRLLTNVPLRDKADLQKLRCGCGATIHWPPSSTSGWASTPCRWACPTCSPRCRPA